MPLIRRPASTADTPAAAPAGALDSASADERWAAVRALPDTPDAAQTLVDALQREREPRVLEAIFTALGRNPAPAASDALIRCVAADDPALRTGAMDALRAAPEALAPRLPELVNDPDPDVRLLACDLARVLPPAEACALLCARLAVEPEVNVAAAAVETLAEIGDETAVPALDACAERFAAEPFLKFAITETARRLTAKAAGSR